MIIQYRDSDIIVMGINHKYPHDLVESNIMV